MSEFFNVVLNKDVVLDDSTISNTTGWTSEKTLREIINKRISKFEELKDVDVTNRKDKQIVVYSADTQKFTTVNGVSAGEIVGNGLKQITKMGIVGSPEKPRIVNIPVNTIDFKVPPVTVWKYGDEAKNQIATKSNFTNGESNDFIEDNQVIFDGKAHLKTEYFVKMDLSKECTNMVEYLNKNIKKSDYKEIVGFDTTEDGFIKLLKVIAIPKDRLIIPKGNMILSNVKYLRKFIIKGTGKNVRIVCSVNDGNTWKYFENQQWKDVDLDVESVQRYGMTIDDFNKINDVFWNSLVTTKKIRFAYLLSMDNINDTEEIDALQIEYDGDGCWEMAIHGQEYKAKYVSNTLLKVEVYFNGDIKINY